MNSRSPFLQLAVILGEKCCVTQAKSTSFLSANWNFGLSAVLFKDWDLSFPRVSELRKGKKTTSAGKILQNMHPPLKVSPSRLRGDLSMRVAHVLFLCDENERRPIVSVAFLSRVEFLASQNCWRSRFVRTFTP